MWKQQIGSIYPSGIDSKLTMETLEERVKSVQS